MTQKNIGMLGGMSWKSSAEYYRLINEGVRDRLGGLDSARCLMWSFDFDDIAVLQREDRWEEAAGLMVDPTAERIKAAGLKRVGLLGTAFTMEQDFYQGRLADRHGLDVIVPDADDRATVHRIIYEELVQP